MKAGALEQMTLHGIVSDPALDNLITAASENPEGDASAVTPENAGADE